MGGLGNQMFQYAFGRALAQRLGRRLVLDLSLMPTGRPPFLRPYELESFSLPDAVARIGGVRSAQAATERSRPFELGLRIARRAMRGLVVTEPEEDRVLEAEEVPRGLAVLVGYWQSHLYFADIATTIRAELTPPLSASLPEVHALARAERGDVIAVHVRRGDYVAQPDAATFHGVQEASYYERGVSSILEGSDSRATVLVFSDDPEWAEKVLRFDAPTIHVERERPLSALDSLALMSRCTHHVLSHSSFSWWGAWLAEHPAQQVIYPSRWFTSRPIRPGFRFPSHWTGIGSTVT